MKIISFNINNATIDKPGLIQFIKEYKKDTQIFCFQEVFEDGLNLIKELLPEFKCFSNYKFVNKHDVFGQVILIDKNLEFIEVKELLQDKPELGTGIYSKIKVSENEILHLINFHGLSRPGNKLDCPERLEQSNYLLNFVTPIKKEKIIILGDFNTDLNTQSISTFEDSGFINLIKKYDIKNTRNEVVWKKYPDTKQYYSDYTFVNNIKDINSFEVPYNEISDHLPMILEI